MVLDHTDCPFRANYEVGYWVQNDFENRVVHHQCVVTGGANTTHVPNNWLQDLKILIYGGVVGLPDNLAIGGV
jgi:hypothetical protein